MCDTDGGAMSRRREQYHQSDDAFAPRLQIGKSVSVGLVVAMMAQLASAIWFAATTVSTVSAQGVAISHLQAEAQENEKARTEIETKLSSMDQNLHDIREMMFQQPQRPAQLVMPLQSSPSNPPAVIM